MAAEKIKFSSVDAYIDTFPPDVQEMLRTLRQTIREAAPDAKETIKYDMPMYTLHGNLVGFAAWKKHIGLYPVTQAMEAALGELAAYKMSGKGTIRFPLNQPLPLPLIRKIVGFRVAEHRADKTKDG